MKQIQQGDVLLKRVDSLPEGASAAKKDSRGVVLAEGEVTGHYHGITNKAAKLFQHAGKTYLKALKNVTLRHQEHKPITVPPGTYEIDRVQEYDYLAQISRPVAD
jgi:hypothetical protein